MKALYRTGIAVLACGLLLSACSNQTYQVTFPLSHESSSSASAYQYSSFTAYSSAATSRAQVAASSASSLPASVKIDVPFQSQAPLQNWDALHEEACEEASLILVQRYLTGRTISPRQMDDEIHKLVDWETANGYAQDVTVSQLKDIAHGIYGLHGTIITDVTADSIKRQIASGNPVIIPAAGQMLGNPYFTGQGPPYHMLVIIGYDDRSFITNDVGTKRGANYRYSYSTLLNAVHDWTGSNATIESGRRAMLVLKK